MNVYLYRDYVENNLGYELANIFYSRTHSSVRFIIYNNQIKSITYVE